MNIKNRIKKIERSRAADRSNDEQYYVSLAQWRRLAAGENILPEIAERNREAFVEWQKRVDGRRREAAATAEMFS